MADTYKILAQAVAADPEEISGENQANIVYTVPENSQAAISSISLINSSDTNEDYYLGVVKAQDVGSANLETDSSMFTLLINNFSNNAYYSTNGIVWKQGVGVYGDYLSVAHGDGMFVAVKFNSSVAAYSTNGVVWTETTLPSEQQWRDVAYGNGKFVAIAQFSAIAAYSTNGITWTQAFLPGSPVWSSITFGNNKFLAISTSSSSLAAQSTDGIVWTSVNMPFQAGWNLVAHIGNNFVAFLFFSNIAYYSADGVSWTQILLPEPFGTYFWRDSAVGNGRLLVLGQNSLHFSTDGISWSRSNSFPSSSVTWSSIAYASNRFVVSGSIPGNGVIAYSTDGVDWISATHPARFGGQIAGGTVALSLNSLSDKQIIIPTRSIEPSAVDEIVGGITLSAGDQVRIYSESPDLIAQVYGVEIAGV